VAQTDWAMEMAAAETATVAAAAAAINEFVSRKTKFPTPLIKKATSQRFVKPPVYRYGAL
jgi:hypothetical protein